MNEKRIMELVNDLEDNFGRLLTNDELFIVKYVDNSSFEKGKKEVFDTLDKK